MRPLSTAIFLGCAMLSALALGWTTGAREEPPATLAAPPRPGGHRADAPDEPNAATLAALRDLDLAVVPAAGPAPEPSSGDDPPPPSGDPEATVQAPPPPPPPPPDIAVVFRGAVAAVVRDGASFAVLLARSPEMEGGSRYLRPGEMFRDGWRLTALSSGEAVLQNGERTRRVSFYGAPAQRVG